MDEVNRNGPRDLPVRHLFGLSVIAARAEEVVAALDTISVADQGAKLAFLNAHGANLADHHQHYRRALERCVLLNDGLGVDIAARVLCGAPFPQNLNGTDFTPFFLATTSRDWRIFLLGAKPGIAEKAATALLVRAPRHRVVGTRHGFFSPADETALVAEIRSSGADMLLVALGNPAQELFVERNFPATGVRLAISVGALFDFLAGDKPRAPRLIRHAGLEWAFRLMIEPRRMWRRYIVGNPRFLLRVAREYLRLRRSR